MRRRTVVALALCILLATLAAASGKAGWRARLVAAKLRGELPHLSWSDVGARLLPYRAGRRPQSPNLDCRGKLKPPVRFAGRGEEPCPAAWETPAGRFWGRLSDGPLLACLMAEQLIDKIYDREPVSLRPGDVVLDVGAHLGTFTRLALRSGAGLVIAVEPEPTNIACFRRNFSQELDQRRVILVEAALWETSGTMDLAPGAGNSGGFTLVDEIRRAPGITVRATTLDEVVQGVSPDRLDFIKMDIEGGERHALRGGRETIRRLAPRMAICVYHRADDRQVIPQLVSEIRPAYRMARGTDQAYFY